MGWNKTNMNIIKTYKFNKSNSSKNSYRIMFSNLIILSFIDSHSSFSPKLNSSISLSSRITTNHVSPHVSPVPQILPQIKKSVIGLGKNAAIKYKITENKVIIYINYYMSSFLVPISVSAKQRESKFQINKNNIHDLSVLLSKYWNKDIELKLVEYNNPINNITLFTDFIAFLSNCLKYDRLLKYLDKIIKYNNNKLENIENSTKNNQTNQTTKLVGAKIILSGRLSSQRKSKKIIHKTLLGRINNDKNITQNLSKTYKSRIGTYNLKLSLNYESLA